MIIHLEEKIIFTECGINIAVWKKDLFQITVQSANTITLFRLDSRLAMLSIFTKGSAIL